MRDEEFKKRLSEVAEWRLPNSDEINDQGELVNRRGPSKKVSDPTNQTLPPMIIGLKCQPKNCEDCGKTVQGRAKEIKYYTNGRVKGYKEKCLACGLHKDPYSGEFCLNGSEASVKWNSFGKGAERRYKPKPIKRQTEPQPEPACIIRKYPETLDPL